MELIVVVLFAAVGWLWFRSKNSKTVGGQRQTPTPTAPAITLTVTTTVGAGRDLLEGEPPRDVGPLTSAGPSKWVLNPLSPLPLTLVGADEGIARRLKTILANRQNWSHSIAELALLIAQHNLRFKEVDDFVAACRPRFEAIVKQAIANSSEWETASEKDREDLRGEFTEAALEKVGVHTGYADLRELIEGQPNGFEDDDELLRRFGGDSDLYSFYLSQLGRSRGVATVKADDADRKSWEKLVVMGLALRGKDIPIQQVLEALRLKDLNEILANSMPKPIGRKAKAVEAVLSLPDLQERLARFMSMREKFQALPPPDLDIETIQRAFVYSTTVATVVQQTYYTAVQTLDAVDDQRRDSTIYGAWEIVNFQDPIPECAKTYCKRYNRLPAKRPPFHVGCDCQLQACYRD